MPAQRWSDQWSASLHNFLKQSRTVHPPHSDGGLLPFSLDRDRVLWVMALAIGSHGGLRWQPGRAGFLALGSPSSRTSSPCVRGSCLRRSTLGGMGWGGQRGRTLLKVPLAVPARILRGLHSAIHMANPLAGRLARTPVLFLVARWSDCPPLRSGRWAVAS